MKTEDNLERQYLIDKVAEQIFDENLDREASSQRNEDVGWPVSGSYILSDGSIKNIFNPQCRLSMEDLEIAISRAEEKKKKKS